MKRTRIIILLAGLVSCSGEIPLTGPVVDDEPVRIAIAEIADTKSTTTSNGTSGEYDHSVFETNDQIRIKKVWNEGNSVETYATYTFTSNTWTATSTPLTLQPGATYQGFFPATASPTIQYDQSLKTDYVSSDHLQTNAVTAPTGILEFTGDNAFKHQNTKLTLVLNLASTNAEAGNAAISGFSISAVGIVTGGAIEETVKLYRAEVEKAVFSAILKPVDSGNKTVKVRLTYAGVSYNTAITPELRKATHYIYTLTIKDNQLVPEGSEITGWKDQDIYSGVITTNSASAINEGGVS